MYHSLNHQVESTAFRIFSPVVLFHDATAAEYAGDNQLIRLKKQRVRAMLKSNVKFWNNVIQTTRQQQQTQPLEEPLSPLSVASSSSSSFQSYYQTQATTLSPTHQKEDTDNDYQNEEEVDEIDELDEDDSMDDEQPHTGLKKKSIILRAVAGTTNSNNGNSRKRRGNLPKNVTAILKQWLIDHCRHPYPTEEEKRVLRLKTDLTLNQISNWFINARRRILPLILAAPIYRQQQPDDNNVSPASYKQKMRRKRGWIASSGKSVKQSLEML